METFSITIRPRVNNFKIEWIGQIRAYLDTNKPDVKYIIAGEAGNGDDINHIQMALKIKSRSDNIRRMIKSVIKFEPEDDMENTCWCKISKSDDPYFTNGYCMKEKKMIETNYEVDNLEIFDKHYNIRKNADKPNGGWECKGINELPYYLKELYEKLNGSSVELPYPSMRALAYMAFGQGKLPFSLVRKIKKSDEIIFRQMINEKTYSELVSQIKYEDDE